MFNYVAPWSCETWHFVPLYVHTCSSMTIKLNLTRVYASSERPGVLFLTDLRVPGETGEQRSAVCGYGAALFGRFLLWGGPPFFSFLVHGVSSPRPSAAVLPESRHKEQQGHASAEERVKNRTVFKDAHTKNNRMRCWNKSDCNTLANLLKEINTFIQRESIKLIKSDSKDIYELTKDSI